VSPSAASLIHRLGQVLDGLQKHGAEPGFPSFFAVNNLGAVRDALALAAVTAEAHKAQVKTQVIAAKNQKPVLADLWARCVGALESYYGLENPDLKQYGITPRRGPASPRTKGTRTLRRNRRLKAQAQSQSQGQG
jgi:hypothetical protein